MTNKKCIGEALMTCQYDVGRTIAMIVTGRPKSVLEIMVIFAGKSKAEAIGYMMTLTILMGVLVPDAQKAERSATIADIVNIIVDATEAGEAVDDAVVIRGIKFRFTSMAGMGLWTLDTRLLRTSTARRFDGSAPSLRPPPQGGDRRRPRTASAIRLTPQVASEFRPSFSTTISAPTY